MMKLFPYRYFKKTEPDITIGYVTTTDNKSENIFECMSEQLELDNSSDIIDYGYDNDFSKVDDEMLKNIIENIGEFWNRRTNLADFMNFSTPENRIEMFNFILSKIQ